MTQGDDSIASFNAGGGPLEDGDGLLDDVGGQFGEDVKRSEVVSELSGELMEGGALRGRCAACHLVEVGSSALHIHRPLLQQRHRVEQTFAQTLSSSHGPDHGVEVRPALANRLPSSLLQLESVTHGLDGSTARPLSFGQR